jgi:N-methylhydantoinase A
VGLVVGIDTGGTFTDMVVFDPASGRLDSLKTSSTPSSPGQAIVNALDEGGIPASDVERFTHGTTVGTNALIERTGCRVAFVTTKGFEDTPYIQRINRKVLYDLRWRKPEPLVASRRLCLGLDERLSASGETLRGIDEDEADPRGGASGRSGLGVARGGAYLARVRALVDDDRRRLPSSAVRSLRREPRRGAP